jgi:hypothetical protein
MSEHAGSTACGWQRVFVGMVAVVGWAICLVVLASAVERQAWPPFDTVLICFVVLPWASFSFSRFAIKGALPQTAETGAGAPRPAATNLAGRN